jgi:hypothetical protein
MRRADSTGGLMLSSSDLKHANAVAQDGLLERCQAIAVSLLNAATAEHKRLDKVLIPINDCGVEV